MCPAHRCNVTEAQLLAIEAADTQQLVPSSRNNRTFPPNHSCHHPIHDTHHPTNPHHPSKAPHTTHVYPTHSAPAQRHTCSLSWTLWNWASTAAITSRWHSRSSASASSRALTAAADSEVAAAARSRALLMGAAALAGTCGRGWDEAQGSA